MSSKQTDSSPAGRTRRSLPFAGVTLVAASLLSTVVTTPAAAQDFSLHLEPAAAIWLDAPQSDRFSPGVYAAIRPSFSLGRVAALQASYAFVFTPKSKDFDEDGSAHFVSAGFRLRPFAHMRPETENLGGFWADFNLAYVHTGDLDRVGFDTGLGYGFQIAPAFAMGPAVRYVQIVQPNDVANVDPNDAQFVTAGLNFTFGRPHREEEVTETIVYRDAPPAECVQQPCTHGECVQQECPTVAPAACGDLDNDGTCNDIDRCPTQVGPAESFGCPIQDVCSGAPLRVLVQFDFDSSDMPAVRAGDHQTMDPVLDAVANAIALDPTCRVGILGHTSQEGDANYNQQLSEQRARAVQRYMTERGIESDRIPARGMGEQCPLVPGSSLELNRRVEFYRLTDGDANPAECLP